jgi:hypothetical protein
MNAPTLTFPIDFTQDLYDALQATVSALVRRIEADGAEDADRAVLARASALLEHVESIG